MRWHPRTAGAALAVCLALASGTAIAAPNTAGHRSTPARTASLHHFRGSVTSVNRNHHWFRMWTTGHHYVRIYTNGATHWNNCNWGQTQAGRRADVYAHYTHGTWIASRMQPWGSNWDDMMN